MTPTIIAVVSIIVWAIFASNKMSRNAHAVNLAKAKTPTNTVGHAKHATGETLTDKVGGLRLAYHKTTGKILRLISKDGQHGIIYGTTGCGKSARWMICAMLDLAGRVSMVYVDPKGNTTAVVGKTLAEKGKLIVCNPYENQEGLFPMTVPPNTPYNPLARLSPDKYGFTVECERIAGTFPDQGLSANETSAYFRNQATDLIAGVIMHVCDTYPPSYRHLTTVRNVITSSNGENFWQFVKDVKENGTPYTQQKLSRFAETDDEGQMIAKSSKEAADVLATAALYTRWFGNEDLGPSLEEDGFQYTSLKEIPTAVALICPLQYLHTGGGKWLKLHVTSAIHELWRNGRGKVPVIFFGRE